MSAIICTDFAFFTLRFIEVLCILSLWKVFAISKLFPFLVKNQLLFLLYLKSLSFLISVTGLFKKFPFNISFLMLDLPSLLGTITKEYPILRALLKSDIVLYLFLSKLSSFIVNCNHSPSIFLLSKKDSPQSTTSLILPEASLTKRSISKSDLLSLVPNA